jgi:pyridoxine 5-phosphate synthase
MSESALPHSLTHTASTALSVNLNKVALLRNARDLDLPSVLKAASLCLRAGAHGVTVHPRPDERHIKEEDVQALSVFLKQWPHCEFNIEGNPFHNLLDLVERYRPHQATLVPDSVEQSTSDHGWLFPKDLSSLQPVVAQIQSWGVRVSLFMDPVPEMMVHCQALGVERVELYTEGFARAYAKDLAEGTTHHALQAIQAYQATAQAAQALGLQVNAGHDLNALNLRYFLSHVPGVKEVSIGHAFIADALEMGYEKAVGLYLSQMDQGVGRGVGALGAPETSAHGQTSQVSQARASNA